MDFTKGLECPNCGQHTGFKGGNIGGGINSTNIKCDCGFSAWVIITRKDHEYSVSATKLNNTEERIYKYKDYDYEGLLELQIKYKMAYDIIDARIRPEGMYHTISEIKDEIEYRKEKF